MATTRKKKTIITGVTADEANEAMASYAKATARVAKINAEMDLQFAQIREKHANELTDLEKERDAAFETLQAYATENQDELFAKKKSLDLANGTIGFRTGTPKLKTLKGFTWASVLNLVKEFLPAYVRTSEEVAKDKLLADREAEIETSDTAQIEKKQVPMRELMAKCGISVVQDEAFYVEPKTEDAQ